MKLKPKYTIPVLWVIVIFVFNGSRLCQQRKYPNKLDTIAEALSKLKK